jgi:hypothetical protein
MQLLNPFRGYSDFFKSGFRAFTNRDRKQSSETSSRVMLDTPPKSTFSDTIERRPRPVSVHVTVQNAPPEKAERRRRSSFPSFPSNWFDHQSTTNFSDETSTIFLRRSSTSSSDSRDSEVWIAEGGLYTVPSINERYIAHLSHDKGYWLELKFCFLLLALIRSLAIHFRLRQMPSQFSWTLPKMIWF